MFQSRSHSSTGGLTRVGISCGEEAQLVWRTDLSPHVLAERVAARLHDRLGSWAGGLEFQVATGSDPWARVLIARIAAAPGGSIVTASVGTRTDLRDIMRFGALLLLATLSLLAICCLTQLQGRELLFSLVGVVLGGVVAWGSAQAAHAWLFRGARRPTTDAALSLAMRCVLREALA